MTKKSQDLTPFFGYHAKHARLPDGIMGYLRRLGTTPTERDVIIQLCVYWFCAERLPTPGTRRLIQALHISRGDLSRAIRGLERKGLVIVDRGRGTGTNTYDLRPMAAAIAKLVEQDKGSSNGSNAPPAPPPSPGFGTADYACDDPEPDHEELAASEEDPLPCHDFDISSDDLSPESFGVGEPLQTAPGEFIHRPDDQLVELEALERAFDVPSLPSSEKAALYEDPYEEMSPALLRAAIARHPELQKKGDVPADTWSFKSDGMRTNSVASNVRHELMLEGVIPME